MPLSDPYGVWVGTPTKFVAQRDNDATPHGALSFTDSSGRALSSAVNIKSSSPDSRLVFWINRNFDHPVLERLKKLPSGFTKLGGAEDRKPADSEGAEGGALDLIRGNLVKFEEGTVVPYNVPGNDNDIVDFLDPVMQEAVQRKAKIFIFGGKYKSNDGIHEVHMNQGSGGKFNASNGTWQDGGLVFYFADSDHWEAFFIAFASQTTHTVDTGSKAGWQLGKETFADLLHAGPEKPDDGGSGGQGDDDNSPPPAPGPGKILIRAALVNPVGDDGALGGEAVYVYNGTGAALDLAGWTLRNGQAQVQALDGGVVAPGGGQLVVKVPDCPLSNKGGQLSLLDKEGLKVDGVSWTKQQARREGKLLYFH